MRIIKQITQPFMIAIMIATATIGQGAFTTSQAYAAEKNQPRININGVGRVDIAPDMATIQLGVVSEEKSARQALTKNNIAMNQVIASMKDGGIDKKDLQTSNFSIRPRYVHHRPKKGEQQKPPRIVGYVVSNNLTVRIKDLEIVGAIIDRAVAMGVNMGGGITFGNWDPSEAINKARTAAMKDAIARAHTLLDAAGAELGPIIEINETFSQPRPVPMARGRMMAESMAVDQVPVEGGENTYEVTVSVSWEIKQ